MTKNHSSLPPVYFNHLYVVLDNKTYRAIQGSDFLQIAFPGKEKRSTLTAAGENWSGTYFYCQDNFLEFFGSGSSPLTGKATHSGHWQTNAQEGWAGLAFSVDQPGGVDLVRNAIHEAFGYDPLFELRQMFTGAQTINWFYNLKLAEKLGLSSFDSWLMEYHPDIFTYKNIPIPHSGLMTRQAYLSSWNKEHAPSKESEPGQSPVDLVQKAGSLEENGATVIHPPRKTESGSRTPARTSPRSIILQSNFKAPPVFSRIISATYHMDQQPAGRFSDILTMLGFSRDISGKLITLAAHGFTIKILPEESGPSGYRLSALRLAMSRPSVAPMVFVFAPGSRLTLNEDLTADWEFGV
jgi:hypothetical protein